MLNSKLSLNADNGTNGKELWIASGDRRTISYRYDGLQRLTGATESPGNIYAYTYDNVGNRLSASRNGLTTSRTYDDTNQLTGWSYDAVGNLLNDGSATSTYDPLNRVSTIGSTTNTYNGDGILVSQTASGTTTRYTQDLVSPLSQILGDGTTRYLYDDGAARLNSVQGATRTWYHTDALGSVRQTLSDTGSVLSWTNYDPWGTPQSTPVDRFGFTGELQQGNLTYLRARGYHTANGTFTARDPFAGIAQHPSSQHPYLYGHGNPVSVTDPSGKIAPFIAKLIQATVEGAVDALRQAVFAYYFDPSVSTPQQAVDKINWWQVGWAFLSSFVGGGKLVQSVIGAAGALIINWLQTIGTCDNYTIKDAIEDCAVNFAIEVIGSYAGELAVKYGSLAIAKGLRRLGMEDLARKFDGPNGRPKGGGGGGGGDSTPDFAKYTPSPNTGFSGVYDPTTGKLVVRPSGDTLLADGSVPPDRVDQFGGHGTLNAQLKTMGANTDKTLGFVLIHDSPGQLLIRWNSGSVNLPNYGDRAVPVQFRSQLITAVESGTGLKVVE